ncbi:MAG: hypothetical protein II306_10050, partial [Clostridia bacterium]|nr:hypothetical protein [Clostridia bacterium]
YGEVEATSKLLKKAFDMALGAKLVLNADDPVTATFGEGRDAVYYGVDGKIDIITNGDQTNTIYDFINDGKSFEDALMTREFEPDAPNYTPRISGILYYSFLRNEFIYKLSILKSANGRPEACNRYFYNYVPENGIGHFIHTYKCDGDPIPSFYGEPEEVKLPNTAEELAELVWNNLNQDNKVSLFVRSIPLDGSKTTDIIINKNK